MPRTLAHGERITRYILFQSHVKKGHASFAAFMPSPKTKEMSVYRTSRCSERRIWALAGHFVDRYRTDNRKVLARGDVSSAVVFSQGLRIVPAPSPHPRHANVIGWPDEKAQQRIKAVVLAEKSFTILRPQGGLSR